MADYTAQEIAADVYEQMSYNRLFKMRTFRAWGDDPRLAAQRAIRDFSLFEDYQHDLSDKDLLAETVDLVTEQIEGEMELTYERIAVYEEIPPVVPLNFTHIAIIANFSLMFIAEAKTVAAAMDIYRKDVGGEFGSEDLKFFRITTYEAGRIEDTSDFGRIIRAADEREITV